MTGDRPWRDEAWLRRKYVDERLSIRAIARETVASESTIWRWLKEHGIRARQGGTKGAGGPWGDEDWLREMHVVRGLSSREIAREAGCSAGTVRRWLRRHDIDLETGAIGLHERLLRTDPDEVPP